MEKDSTTERYKLSTAVMKQAREGIDRFMTTMDSSTDSLAVKQEKLVVCLVSDNKTFINDADFCLLLSRLDAKGVLRDMVSLQFQLSKCF